jgi:type II restriction enzyme
MNEMQLRKRVDMVCGALKKLTPSQLAFIEQMIDQFCRPFIKIMREAESDIVSDAVLHDFGDVLRIHHCFSKESLSKDRFEYAFERILNANELRAELAPKGNPGHDITIDGQECSLKTQADRSIKEDELHISKFMELGKGRWSASVKDLKGLREQFLNHMEKYQRIFSLRCLSKAPENWHYELVEIPKSLLLESTSGKLSICRNSKQSPKPGYCDVVDASGDVKYQLYFDGGTERKLQIKHLKKKWCIVHAVWIFSVD